MYSYGFQHHFADFIDLADGGRTLRVAKELKLSTHKDKGINFNKTDMLYPIDLTKGKV